MTPQPRPGWPINRPEVQLEYTMTAFAEAAARLSEGRQSQAVERLRQALRQHYSEAQTREFLSAIGTAVARDFLNNGAKQ
jgi:Tfp pilus assembly protein FimV